jgi:hypothetical protein
VRVIRRRRVLSPRTRSWWSRQELRRVHEKWPYWVPKGRFRETWASWADASWNMANEAGHDAAWEREADGEPSSMMLLTVHNEELHGPVPQEVSGDVPKESVRRRALAQQLHAQLNDLAAWTGPDRLGWSVLNVPVSRLDGVQRALREAPLAAQRDPGSVLVTSGRKSGRVVMRVHGDTFSVVFHVSPGEGPVLVLLDELQGYAVRVDTDADPKGINQVWAMKWAILQAVNEVGRPRPRAVAS